MTPDRAKAIAQDALIWLSGEPEALSSFLHSTGASVEDVRKGYEDQEFLGFVLDFVLMTDEAVLAASAAAGVRPEHIARARVALPGGATPDWT
jgi:predicted transposase YbfD/YdcC